MRRELGEFQERGPARKLTFDFICSEHGQPSSTCTSGSEPNTYPGSSSLSTRSLGSSFPRDVWSLLAFSPPPGLANTENQRVKHNIATPRGDTCVASQAAKLKFLMLKAEADGRLSCFTRAGRGKAWQWWMYLTSQRCQYVIHQTYPI